MGHTGGSTPLYTQRLDRTVLMMVLAIESASVVLVLAIMLHSKASWWQIALVLGLIGVMILLVVTSHLRIRLGVDRLRWTFVPFWRSSLRYDDIASVRVENIDAMRDYMGWGIKLTRKGTGVIACSGPAVRIERRSVKRDLVITCDEAQELAANLLELVPDAVGDTEA